MRTQGGYDRYPVVQVREPDSACLDSWPAVLDHLRQSVSAGAHTIAFECYPGVLLAPLLAILSEAFPKALVLNVEAAYKPGSDLRATVSAALTDDPVFGVMREWKIDDYFDELKLAELRAATPSNDSLILAVGTGATRVLGHPDLLLYSSVTRWELQGRQRAGLIGNLGLENVGASPSLLYKNAYFIEWRMADALRHELYSRIDFFLDLDDRGDDRECGKPLMVAGETLRRALSACVRRPFRVEPFFDAGPWGGQWMKDRFHLPDGPPNYAWCFDCVPEVNTLVLGFGAKRFRLPSVMLVHEHARELLGEEICRRFGAEFPIRFDLLDTFGGGNLSLQVHPLTTYIREHFGIDYTQDESYYILDCAEGSELYLGLRSGIDPTAMRRDLEAAQSGAIEFAAEQYVNTWPTRRHDHFAIPAGTVHCSGAGNVVLEISATPYIFTFKLWDWARLGLDGKPRPIHLEHGLANIQWERDTGWVERELLRQVEPIAAGEGWSEERTGLHRLEFIETRRTWFTAPVPHDTCGTLNVLNLVEGEAAVVESPDNAFEPFEAHYGETFIVPACVGRYSVRPLGSARRELATIKAYVRRD